MRGTVVRTRGTRGHVRYSRLLLVTESGCERCKMPNVRTARPSKAESMLHTATSCPFKTARLKAAYTIGHHPTAL
jgi:hypothetical protein